MGTFETEYHRFELKLYHSACDAARFEYLKIKSVMPNGGCGLTDEEEAWVGEYQAKLVADYTGTKP